MGVKAIGHWNVDVRAVSNSKALSFDVTQHLSRRLVVGPALVIVANPPIFLSAIRKRWMRLLHDIRREHSRTLNRTKRDMLAQEIAHLSGRKLTSKLKLANTTDALFVAPNDIEHAKPSYTTMYITVPSAPELYTAIVTHLATNGLLVVYGEWSEIGDMLLKALS